MLEEAKNVIAIKSLINGKGSDFSGIIVDSNNNEIAHFENEYLGMSKSAFYYKKSEKYKAVISILDTIIKIDVPLPKKEGVAIKMNNHKDFINIQLQTNLQTLRNNADNYFILFHQNNKLINYADIVLKDTSNIELKINKNAFYNGVNTITVFKNKEPILERKFFVYAANSKIDVTVEKQLKVRDSVTFKLKTVNNVTPASLSVSVLSVKVELEEETNIEAALLLTPYLEGYIEKPSYYFNKDNKERFKHIDLLLLTQGWTQYSTSEFINSLNPKYVYDFEVGYKLSGSVKPLASNNLALVSKDNRIIDELFLNSNLDFTFKKLLIYKGDSVKLSFVKLNKELMKPESISFDSIISNKEKLKTKINSFYDSFRLIKKEGVNEVASDFSDINATKLDTVSVSTKRRNKTLLRKKPLVNKYRKTVFDIGKYMPLEVSDKYRNESLLSYLQSEEGVRLVNWKGLEWYLEVGVNKEAILFIDGTLMESGDLGNLKLKMKDIEAIMMEPIKMNRRYQVFTTENYRKGIEELYVNYVFNYGYTTSKKYYTPIHDFNLKNETREIDWKPMLKTNTMGEVDFKVKNSASGYAFSIQGITDKGKLISKLFILE